MNKNDQQFMAQKIRTQYMEKEPSELDALKELDKKVRRPALFFGYVFGTISALIMGAGMSLVMTNIGEILGLQNTMTYGIVIGIVGMIMAIINYPITKSLLNSRKKKYADKIFALSNKIINQ